jgi:hypothetical protein
VVGVAGEVALGDEATEGLADHDGVFDAEGVAESDDVVGPHVEPPVLLTTGIAAAVAAMVVVDDLCDVGEVVRSAVFEVRVVHARSAVQQQHGRPFHHLWAVWNETLAVDVDIETHVADVDPHCCPPTVDRSCPVAAT